MSEFLLGLITTYKYFIIFPFAVVEGTTAALVSGFFISLGTLHFPFAYIALLLGDFIPDIILYNIGRYGNKNKFLTKYGPKVGITIETEESFKRFVSKHDLKAFIISKIAYGFAVPFLISAGFIKYPFKKYLSYCTLISAIRILIVMFIGYYLGSSYKIASDYINYFYIVVSILVILFIITYIYITRKIRNNFLELEKEEEIR